MLAVITHKNAGALGKGEKNTATLLGGPEIEHYDQAVALVVAETLEQARDAAKLVRVRYAPEKGRFDLAAEKDKAAAPPPIQGAQPGRHQGRRLRRRVRKAAVKLDVTYTTPDQSHMPMEPFATTAAWSGGKLTVWTANQMVAWGVKDLALDAEDEAGGHPPDVALHRRRLRRQAVGARRSRCWRRSARKRPDGP